MTGPRNQHFLPRAAHLRHFCVPSRPGFIYLYMRGREPRIVNIANVANETLLYSVAQAGNYSHDWETRFFAPLDGQIVPIVARLNDSIQHVPVELAAGEMPALLTFIAFQCFRTPAFRDLRSRHISEMVAGARVGLSLDDLRRAAPADLALPSSDEELKSVLHEALDDVQAWVRTRGRGWSLCLTSRGGSSRLFSA